MTVREVSQRPKDLVFTLFGEYLLDVEAVWVGHLIALLQPFGLSDGGVRTVLSRMAKKGWLQSRRDGKHSFYSLTSKGRSLLEEGHARIYRPEWKDDWDGSWLLLAYSLPQTARSARDRLRDRLTWLGFGSIGNGLWLTPHDITDQVEALAARMGVIDSVMVFRGERRLGATDRELVARCWDLDGLAREYEAFSERWSPLGAALSNDDTPPTAAEAFAHRFRLIHEFRRFTLEDPFLPRRLLPQAWAGDEASRLFLELREKLSGPADDHVASVLRSS